MLSREKVSVKACNNKDLQSFCPSNKGNTACTSIFVRLGDVCARTTAMCGIVQCCAWKGATENAHSGT
eukprot:10794687-Prorocentrum_lima.AAC.1